ncbi:MAG TPA: peptidase MA family metallohydrolase [Candidatus Limnocylindrales bacterium]|nr:peptidase MA family metallohydrolase [Candidatus Limnocylindrales bacterium]
MRVSRRAVRVTAVAALVFGSSGLLASPARAASVDFGRPTIEGSFDSGVVANQPVTLDGDVDRIEVLVTLADSPGPLVSEIAPPSTSGATTLTHRLGGPDAHILPNTPVRGRWRITVDGTVRIGPEVRTVIADERFDWKTIEGDVVRVHWYDGDRAFGERALRIGEREVEETAKLFGVTESEPVDFFIYADRDAFYDALGPGTRENVGGQANAEIRTLFADIAPSAIDDPWVENVVPHELIHLVFDTAVQNPYHFPPRWLNEGLAVYLSVGLDAGDRAAVENAAGSGDLIPLDGLVAQFPTGAGFGLAYSESVSAVDFLVRKHGQDTLVSLVTSYAEGKTDDEAFEGAIGMDLAAFNDAWLADIGAKDPVKYGPQPAAPGPRPSDWGATASQPPVEPAPTRTPLARVDVPLQRADGSPGLIVVLLLVAGAIGLLVVTRRRGSVR